MIEFVTYREGQSIYDLCLQVYGTLDQLVKFCQDNDVTDINAAPNKSEYQYDTSLVKYDGNKNIYTTNYIEPELETSYLITEDGTGYLITEDASGFLIPE